MKMKEFFKYALVVVISFACMIVYNLCTTQPSIIGITKGVSDGVYDTYIVNYSNGKTDAITIKNGENGKDISVQDLYLATKTAQNKGDDYTLLDFINEYLSFTVDERDETKAYLGALSTVEVYCEFPTTIDFLSGKQGYDLAAGAGLIYQPEGVTDEYYIVTNYHMVYNRSSLSTDNITTKITCFLYGSNTEITSNELSSGGYTFTYGSDGFNCTYVGGSMENDIAVLKVNDPSVITSSNARPVTVSQDDPIVGETVVAIGNPEGMGTSVTRGVVSVDSEYLSMTAVDNVTTITFRAIRFDASINGGNSGGGLFNTKGELVGIVNSKLEATEIEGMAFALPVQNSIRVADNLIKNASTKKASKAVLGLKTKIATSKAEFDAETNNIKIVETIEVVEVSSGSISEGKLMAGDIINSVVIDGVTYNIDRNFRLSELVWLMDKDKVITFNITRMNNPETAVVVITEECFKTVA